MRVFYLAQGLEAGQESSRFQWLCPGAVLKAFNVDYLTRFPTR